MTITDINKEFKYYYNNYEYIINTYLCTGFLFEYSTLTESCTPEEIIKSCILYNNESLSNIFDSIPNEIIIEILNNYVINSTIDFEDIFNTTIQFSPIQNYDDFLNFITNYKKLLTKNISLQFSNLFNNNQETLSNLYENFNNICCNVGSTFKALESINNYLNEIAETATNYLEKLIEKTNKLLNLFINDINKFPKENIFHECTIILINNGYPYLDIEVSDLRYICDNKKDDNIKNIIDEIISETYTIDVINKMLEKWRTFKFLEKRLPILEDSIFAYKTEKYNLSIPVLFSQLEGIIADVFDHKENLYGKKYKDYITKIFAKASDTLEYNEDITRLYFFNNVLEHFVHGKDIPSFSRHAIMHGGDIKYGTRINNLKLLIMFDTIMINIKKVLFD